MSSRLLPSLECGPAHPSHFLCLLISPLGDWRGAHATRTRTLPWTHATGSVGGTGRTTGISPPESWHAKTPRPLTSGCLRSRWRQSLQRREAGRGQEPPGQGSPRGTSVLTEADGQRGKCSGGRRHPVEVGHGWVASEAPLRTLGPKGASTQRWGGECVPGQGPSQQGVLRRELRGVPEERPGAELQGRAPTPREGSDHVQEAATAWSVQVCPAAQSGSKAPPPHSQGRNGREAGGLTQPSSASSPTLGPSPGCPPPPPP